MYVCLCNGVTERDIREAAAGGCSGLAELTMRTGCGACCGSCVETACELLDRARPQHDSMAAADTLTFVQIAEAA